MRLDARRVIEHLGAARLTFDLCEAAGYLELRLARLHFMAVPCPRWLLPKVTAQETGQHETLHFCVQASLPVIGNVTSYRGQLTIADKEPL